MSLTVSHIPTALRLMLSNHLLRHPFLVPRVTRLSLSNLKAFVGLIRRCTKSIDTAEAALLRKGRDGGVG